MYVCFKILFLKILIFYHYFSLFIRIVTPADEKKDHFSVYQRMTLEELDTKHYGVILIKIFLEKDFFF